MGEDELRRLPIFSLEWDEATNETLRALGLATIGDLLTLPRDAFARRFGAARLDDLDRVRGVRSDPQPLYNRQRVLMRGWNCRPISPKPHS